MPYAFNPISGVFDFYRTSSSGGGLTEIAFTGSVNGSNQIFTALSQPTYIVSDGVWFKATDSNGVTQWSYSLGTITLTIPPPINSIYGF